MWDEFTGTSSTEAVCAFSNEHRRLPGGQNNVDIGENSMVGFVEEITTVNCQQSSFIEAVLGIEGISAGVHQWCGTSRLKNWLDI